MSLDAILLWLSARGGGSWPQFRGAIEGLHVDEEADVPDPDGEQEHPGKTAIDLPVYQHVRFALERLGHAEFFTHEADWRVVPPTLALLPELDSEGVLCGARSPGLLLALGGLSDVEVVASETPGMPRRILIRGASRRAVASAASRLGCHVQEDAPNAILSAVTSVRDEAVWKRTQIPETPGWTVHSFSPSQYNWTAATRDVAASAGTGLFRFQMKYQRYYYLRWHGETYSIPVQVGKYAITPLQRRILVYDQSTRVLSVPAVYRPPLLIERALVLCSGFLARSNRSSKRLEYTGVPAKVAYLAAQLLRQAVHSE